jgi:hypothetical protein
MPAACGIQWPVIANIPSPESESPVIGTLPESCPPSAALPVTDIGVATSGKDVPSALTGAESVTAYWLPTSPDPTVVSRIGTSMVPLATPTVTAQL